MRAWAGAALVAAVVAGVGCTPDAPKGAPPVAEAEPTERPPEPEPEPEPAVPIPEWAEISLHAGPCYGSCPVFDLAVRPDGRLWFRGRTRGLEGERLGRVPPATLQPVVRQMVGSGVLDLDPEYRERVSDSATVWLGVTLKDRSVRISEYGEAAPPSFRQTTAALEALLDVAQWDDTSAAAEPAVVRRGCEPVVEFARERCTAYLDGRAPMQPCLDAHLLAGELPRRWSTEPGSGVLLRSCQFLAESPWLTTPVEQADAPVELPEGECRTWVEGVRRRCAQAWDFDGFHGGKTHTLLGSLCGHGLEWVHGMIEDPARAARSGPVCTGYLNRVSMFDDLLKRDIEFYGGGGQ